jgi:hypothetical protein
MFQDAQTTAAWQSEFGFFPVVDRVRSGDLARSILWRFVSSAPTIPWAAFDVDKTTTCPASLSEIEGELRDHPERGMPFGFPPLTTTQSRRRSPRGFERGAGGPGRTLRRARRRAIAKWEDFFNGSDPRAPLVSAYLFEHLFYAHLRFDDAPGTWFRLVRSRTPRGAPIDEIATRSAPTTIRAPAPFYYRLRRIRETLVEKTHVPYR